MDKQKVLAQLIWDLSSFLSALDAESLSEAARANKEDISGLLSSLQTDRPAVDSPSTMEDAEYMIMSCPSSSPSNQPAGPPGTEAVSSSELLPDQISPAWPRDADLVVPPLPPGGPGGDDEDDDDEDAYEEAEPYRTNSTCITEKAESESSHYESYGEEDEDEPVTDRAHYIQWSASQPCLRPAPESRLCGYLWRRKWLGQWSKQLFLIRREELLGYKCPQDLLPQLEVDLRGCRLVSKPRRSRRIQHQIQLVPLGSERLVLGFSSFQQAEEWRKVIEEVRIGGEMETSLTRSDLLSSCRSSWVHVDSEEKKPFSRINKHKGVLSVLMNCQWQSLLCRVEAGLLNMFGEEEEEEEEEERAPQYTVQLRGCDVTDGPDTARSPRITLSMLGDQLAVLEFSSSGEKQRWLKLLQDGASVTQETTGGALSGLQTRRFPTSNPYMVDPFSLSGPVPEQPIYCNTSVLEHMAPVGCVWSGASTSNRNNNSNRKGAEVERGVQKLELTGARTVPLRAESESNLACAGLKNKRTSFRQSLAICSERAQAGFLNPLLRRTASAKISLRRTPSSLFIEHGKVFQRRKEWETKAAP
ncbi:actin filament-associated protein 1-like 2 isoform X1 [Pungitius pungitius]|uniref:actin filament-associated protein 1-like 2 isoform X1 n=1 Tax=Pungitius pungitius TaxID=134920 RepID=UPI002E13E1E9